MVAVARDMFFPFLTNAKMAKEEVVKKPVAKDERSVLIDKMVDSLGLNNSARRRYFKLAHSA